MKLFKAVDAAIDNYEIQYAQSIYSYCENNQFNKAVFSLLVSATNIQFIEKKSKALQQEKSATKLRTFLEN